MALHLPQKALFLPQMSAEAPLAHAAERQDYATHKPFLLKDWRRLFVMMFHNLLRSISRKIYYGSL
jgi:hypothetical protein